MIVIVDYGLGNLGSIANMLKVIGENPKITNDKEIIQKADGIVLPGVGAFDAGMQKLTSSGLDKIIKERALSGIPIIGICLGMQLLGNNSEEGTLEGLKLIPFKCYKFSFSNNCKLKIPHMGWDVVDVKKDCSIVKGLSDNQRYYFVHSYYAVCDNTDNVLMTCDYGHEFAAAVINNNIIGVQFHPEKSHDFGMALLRNFVKICREQRECFQDQE